MAGIGEVYKCDTCGNIVLVVHGGAGELVCCGKPMRLMTENTVDAAREKHVPVIEVSGDTVTVKVGGVPHPMEEKHFIEWIQVITEKGASRKFLKPGDRPESFFKDVEGLKKIREYCNIHGLWEHKEGK